MRFVRVAIPLAIVLGSAGTYASYKWLGSLQALANLPISTEGVVLSGTKIMMQQPLVNGYTKDKQPYSVTARTAAQDLTNPDAIELKEIQATLTTADKGKVRLTALEGLYDGKSEKLTLQRQVVVSSPEFEATLREAVMHVRKGDVVSEQPVDIKMLQGALAANRLEINQSGAVILFDRGVTLVIDGATANREVTGSVRQPEKSDKSGLFKGLTPSRNDPVKISAGRLEVRDKDKRATFSGSVLVVQGDTEVRCDTLIVYYESEMGKSAAKGEAGGGGNQQIRRMEAKGSVRVTQNEQRAQGDRAEFDMQKNIITLKGKVVVARGDDMLAGETLSVDLTNGVSRMESGGGRVQGMFKSNSESEKQAPANFKGLATQNRNDPVKISAARLEVRDKDKRAAFSGNVHVIQGETEMRSDALVIFYDSEAGKGASNPKQQLRRMEAKGSVKVHQKDQRAHGDRAEFDMRKNTVTLKGNVVLARGDDVLTGHTVVVDLTSGLSQIDSGGGRVQGMFKASPGQGSPKFPGKQN